MRSRKAWKSKKVLPIVKWVETFRYFSEEASPFPGKYSFDITPWIKGMLEAAADPNVREVVCMKSAGIAWTEGFLNNWLGWKIDTAPNTVIGLFPSDSMAIRFMEFKFEKMISATPRLVNKVDLSSRKNGNTKLFKKFPGGHLLLVGSNSVAKVQSDHKPYAFVEEPDRCAVNASGQGSSISHLHDRVKAYPQSLFILGGSPGIKGRSITEDSYLASDQRRFFVPCNDCGESHVLSWENVHWDEDSEAEPHEMYGQAKPDSAFYACPLCGSIWSNIQKNYNVRRGEWRSTKPFTATAGFHINEIYSAFPGSTLSKLVERFLKAKKKADSGNQFDMMVFMNTALGLPYEYKSDAPEVEELKTRAAEYLENTVPNGGLLLVSGIDVQHNFYAVLVVAVGRDEEMFIVSRVRFHGNTTDANDPVHSELEKFLFQPFKHQNGKQMLIKAVSIDSSDGSNNDNVYKFVRKHKAKGVMAVKGDSHDYGTKEIFSKPKTSIDTKGKLNTKASKYGLQPYIVGTYRAKDLIYSRLKLKGRGAGRIHFYKDYPEASLVEILAEVKIPHPSLRGKEKYECKSGVRNEDLDCLVYAHHAARSLKTHIMSQQQWAILETDLMQASVFDLDDKTAILVDKPAAIEAQLKPAQVPAKQSWINHLGDWL